ncbi:hypothetical protein K502DRAFT_369099 [Neoconidiobolus thromboides FSU 785]|nr:hypothetical protein K502DRAFT_369099 [Neoconidiobolus thromboides FSU 785]
MNSLTATVLGVSVGAAYLFSRICKKDEFSPWYTKYFSLFRPEYPFQLDYDKGYEKMMEIFKDNFEQGREVGASVTVYSNGNKVVDSYGGYQIFEKKIPFTENTFSTVYSSTKFMVCNYILF